LLTSLLESFCISKVHVAPELPSPTAKRILLVGPALGASEHGDQQQQPQAVDACELENSVTPLRCCSPQNVVK